MKQTTAIMGRTPWLILLFTFTTLFSFAQTPIRCYTDEMDAILRANNPEMLSQSDFENWIQSEIQNNAGSKIIGGVYQIPVVFHVIHNGEAEGTASNVSFAAIQSQIDVLNEDFRRMMGTNGWNTNLNGADTEIEFCLAQRRPDGSAFVAGQPGVNRINRTTAGFTAPPFTTTYIDATIKPWTYNGGVPTATRGWDPNKYMNIWLCNISGGILGYAQFPQSPLGGMGCGTPSTATDGVVFLYNSIGKSAVTGYPGPYNEGRTATHEIGHWLGLRHIWGDGGCTVDDFCNDTPLAGAANYGCPTGTNSCSGAPDAGVDMIENYMDYTDDMCMNIFTNDQKARMRTVLENSPLRVNLINSDACVPPNPSDASIVDIVNPKGDNCAGSITPVVVLRNRGSNNLTSATISYKIDNGTATTFAWTGTLTPGNSVNVTLPAFTATLGTHNFKSYSTLPNGITDPSTLYDTSSINFVVSNGEMAPFIETFEGSVFPPDVRWVVDNTNSDCYEWVGASATSITGVLNNNAAQFPGFGNTSASTENLVTPIFILPCNATAANIQFDVAYRRRNTTVSNYDRLYIEISENCGATWNTTAIYDKTGTALQVITTTLSSYYTPVGSSDWRTETINLLPFVTGTSKNVKFRFRAVAANGNNIYIDNFRFNATTPGEIEITQNTTDVLDGGYYNYGSVVAGTPTTAVFTITNTGTSNLTLTGPITVSGTGFTLGSTFGTTTVAAGATTTFSVVFNSATAGSFTGNVSFGTNDCDEGTYNFQLNATATANPPVADFSGTPLTVCAGSTVTFTDLSTNATSWSWNFGPGATPATSTAQNPTVTFNTVGTNTITLTATNGFGSDVETKTNYITVLDATGVALPITEGFTGATFVPTNWSLINANSSAITWVRNATVGFAPTAGNSMMFDNFTASDGDDDQVRMPGANFTGLSSATLVFDVAYARYDATYSDGLEVLVSTDCGITFTSVYSKSGTTLATAADVTTAFTPTAAQWRTETVDLTPYIGNSKVIVSFKNLSGYGNRLFVDNINLTGVVASTPPVASFTGAPTTICAGSTVTYTNTSTGSPTSYSWSFPGGTPATSTAANPTVTYSTPGVFNVSLTATNAGGSNTSTQTNYITVNAIPAAPVVTVTNNCGNSVLSATGTNLLWSTGATTSPITVTTAGTYTVTQTVNGCVSSAGSVTAAPIAIPAAPVVTVVNGCGTSTLSATGSNLLWSTGATTSSITTPTAGAYTVTQTVGGCTSTAGTGTAAPIAIPSAPVVTVVNGCGTSTLTATGTNLLWSTGATTSSITTPTAGAYTVTQTVSGCTSTAGTGTAAPIAIPSAPVVTVVNGCGISTLSATGTNLLWSTGATTSSITTPTAGAYTVTQTVGGCTSTAGTGTAAPIAIPSAPVVTVVNGCGTSTLTATGTNLLWSTGATTSSITTPTAGTYTVTQTVGGCTSAPSTVVAAPQPLIPTQVTLLTPANSAINVAIPVTFNWNAAPETSVTYSIQIATDAAFTTIVDQSTGLTANNYTSSILTGGTTYYWHVQTVSPCGSSSYSTTFSFTTSSCSTYSSTVVPVTISATGTPTVTSTITVPTGGTINDVNVLNLIGTHTRVRNLTFSLTSPTGTTVTLMSQPCTNAATNFDIDFDDAAASAVYPCPPTDGNAYQPLNALSAFNGQNAAGTWTLTIVDNATNNGGQLTAWSLEICTSPLVPCTNPDVAVNSGDASICSGNSTTLAVTSGNLNDATNWNWYSGSCGGTLVGTGTSISVSPSTTTTYFVRGEGACVTPGVCSQLTVTVNPTPTAPTVSGVDGCGSSVLTATGSNLLWSTGATTASITVTVAGPYTVTQTVGGCTSALSTVAANPVVTPAAPVTTVSNNCGNSILTASGSNLLWSTGETTSTITVTTAGTYSVTQTVSGCTSAPASETASPLVLPTITLGTTTNPTVCGSANGSIVVNGSGTGTVSWSGTATGSATAVTLPYTISGLAAGTYSIVFNNGCASNTLSGSLADPSAPSAPVVTVTNNCGSSVLTASGTNLIWSTGATTASITVSTAGSYTVTQMVGGCTSAPATVTAAPIAIPSSPTVSGVDGCGSSVLTATGSNLLWSTGETTSTITVTSAGAYTVTQTVNGCTSAPSTVAANPTAIPSSPTVSGVDGCGSSVLTATGSNLLWSTGATTSTITVTSAGAYTATQTVNGCTSAPSTVAANPTAIPSSPTVSGVDGCGSSVLTATGSNLLWSTGATTSTITVTSAGAYTVTQTVGGCTSAPSTVAANPNAIPSAPAVSGVDGCGSSVLTATGSNLLWSTGATTSTITVTSAGAYTVTQTVNGCTSAPSTVAANPTAGGSAPVTTVTNNCGNSILTVSGAGSILWSTGETSATIVVSTAGTYTVTLTNGTCVSSPASIVAAPNAIPTAPIITVNDKCGTSDLTTSATGSLMWSTSETTSTITVTTPGTYYVSQTVNGCTSPVGTAVANPFTVPSVTFAPLADVCINTPAFALTGATPSGGVYSGTGVTANQFDPSVAGYGVFTIVYTYTDVNGCSDSNQQPITVGCAGIDEESSVSLVIYPNPSNGQFTISTTGQVVENVTIFDAAGRLVQIIDNTTNLVELSVDLSEYGEGVYTLEIKSDKSTTRERFVLSK